MSQLGRISGPLLKANLLRQGVDLAFETDLLYLDVNNLRVGIKTTSPTHDLQVVGTTRTTNLEVTDQLDIGNLTVTNNTISSSQGDITLNPADGYAVYNSKAIIDLIDIEGNSVTINQPNTDLNINTTGTGKVVINNDTQINGNLYVTGDITADGSIQIGDQNTDNITFNADVSSNIIPNQTETYTLGSDPTTGGNRWRDIWVKNLFTDAVDTGEAVIDGVNIASIQGKIWFVATNGNDTYTGSHQNDPFATIEKALSVAQRGDTVFVYPGTFKENFPLVVPPGVTLRGSGIRSVKIVPRLATRTNDAIKLDDETTIEDLTIADFFYNSSTNTGYAFAFKNGFRVTSRSAYVRNITVLTKGSPTSLSVQSILTQNNAGINRIKDIIDEIVVNTTVAKSSGNSEIQQKNLTAPGDSQTGTELQQLIDLVLSVITNGPLQANLPAIIPNGNLTTNTAKINAADLITANVDFLKAELVAFINVTYPGFWTGDRQTKATRDLGLILDALIYDITHGGNERSIEAGIAFWQQPADDPLGFDSSDAGRGAYVDGSIADPLSLEASMLFHSVTFICPAADCLVALNGVRIEWLNSFTYFGNKGMFLTSGSSGFAGNGKTRIKISNTTGTWAVGNTVTYYDTNGTTVLASGVIEAIDGDFYIIDGKNLGWETPTDRPGKIVTTGGDAQLDTVIRRFGTASLKLDGTGDYISYPSQPDFRFGRPKKTISLVGNASASSVQSKFNGGSIFLDGTGDYLTLSSDPDLGFGTGDFTIEGWFYRSSTTASVSLFDFRSASNTNAPWLYISSGSLVYIVGGVNRISGPSGFVAGNWYHVALSRTGTSTRLFVNGNQVGSTWTDTTNYAQAPLTIGARYLGDLGFEGYIDEIRITKGLSRYTGNFIVPTIPFINDLNTVLLIHGDTNISDDNNDEGDFTVEFWMYRIGNPGASQILFDMRQSIPDIAPMLYINSSNLLIYRVNGVDVITGPTIPQNTWLHVALNRSGTTTRVYLNGTQIGLNFVDQNYYDQRPVTIGAQATNFQFGFDGHIDELRITKGLGRYPANFVVQTDAFIGDVSTVLLLHFNGPDASVAIIDDGVTLQDIRTSAGGRAASVDFIDYSDFGAELRSIGSAAVYGNFGIYGDGIGVTAYLIGQNLAYIGNGGSATNDPTTVIQENEVVQLNGAKIYFSSVNHKGDFRIGDLFYVNQETGNVEFTNASIDFSGGITFSDEFGNSTVLDANQIRTGAIRISGNTIESITGDVNVFSVSDQINFLNNVNIAGNLDVVGNVTIGGNITIGNQTSDSVNIIAKIDSNLVPKVTNTYDIGTTDLRWKTLYTNQVLTSAIELINNVIRSTVTNADLQLTATGTGRIYIPTSNVLVNNNITVNGDTTLAGTTIVGTITHTGNTNQTGNLTQTGNINVTGNLTATGFAQFKDIRLENNTVSTTLSNNDLRLEAAGTGRIYVPLNDVEIDTTLTVVGTTNTAGIINTGTIQSPTFTTANIRINGNLIETTTTNTNLELRANGTGIVLFEGLGVNGNEISSNTDTNIVLAPTGTGIVDINSTQSLRIPRGTTAERPLVPQTGMMRFNTSFNGYEGYDGTNWIRLDGVYDLDQNTYITAELTPGANDNIFRFYNDGVLTAELDSTKFTVPQVNVDAIQINDNTISTTTTNTNLVFAPNGTGSVVIGNFSIRNNVITNTVNNSVTVFQNTGPDAYFKISGTTGFVIPSGTTNERPTVVDTGLMRYDTSSGRVEIYNGVTWIAATGEASGISLADAEDLSIRNAILFG